MSNGNFDILMSGLLRQMLRLLSPATAASRSRCCKYCVNCWSSCSCFLVSDVLKRK